MDENAGYEEAMKSTVIKNEPEAKQEFEQPSLDQLFDIDDDALSLKPMKNEVSQLEEGIDKVELLGGAVEFKSDHEGHEILLKTPTVKKSRPAPILLGHLPSAKEEASLAFQELEQCHYQPNYLGESGQEEMMSCDCKPDYGNEFSELIAKHIDVLGEEGINHACGPDSNCINRLTSIECTDEECNCGDACQNQRFQLREYANIDVIQAGKKGYGLRAGADFPKDIFVYEYVGEVIGEKKFRQRQIEYKDQGEQHFYFMMLQKGEYIDATRKGGYGRFINHSCEPNCYVDKWVVGSKLRMGIFTKRKILQGEELTFDYNVDRYGGDATPCYCGEPTCLGYIGGKTQTEAANKLSQNVVEALGLDDEDDWDEAKPKKNRRRKKGEEDEEYVNDLVPRGIQEKDVPKIMATLLQASERWLLKKLLQRISNDGDEKIQAKIVMLHGYQTLGAKLEKWKEDSEICVLILQILQKWPSMTKNKISSSKIETYVKALASRDESSEDVKELSTKLLETWGNLEMAYRIPRRVRPPKSEVVCENTKKDYDSPASTEKTEPSSAPAPKDFRSRPKFSNIPRDQPWRKQDQRFDRSRDPNKGYNGHTTPRTGQNINASTPILTPTKIDTVNQDLQAIIDAATKKQQEQAELLKKQEAQKAEDAANLLKQEAAKRADRARRHEAHKAEKEKRAVEKRQKLKDRTKSNGKDSKSRNKDESDGKKLERIMAKFVPNAISKYQEKLGKEQFKKRARELVKLLVAKELKKDKPDVSELNDHKKAKIKAFSRDFIEKLITRQANGSQKSAARDKPRDKPGDTSESRTESVPTEELEASEGDPEDDSESESVSDDEDKSDDDEDITRNESPADEGKVLHHDAAAQTVGTTNGSKRTLAGPDTPDEDRSAKREKVA